ncbi:MAG: Tfp pilus assembly protein PilF, partial [Lentimonas sp.]
MRVALLEKGHRVEFLVEMSQLQHSFTSRLTDRFALGGLALCLLVGVSVSLLHALPVDKSEADLIENPLITQAYTALQSGQPEQALEAFQQVLDQDANNITALLGQAII